MPRTKQFDEQEVLKKAMELFWEKGFHATSMQDLVSYLCINRASLYDTFGGKEALFEKAFELYRSNSIGFLREVLDSTDSVKGRFQKLFDFAIKEAIEDESRKGCFVVNVTTELVPGDERIQVVLNENKENVEQLFVSVVQDGIEKGEISPTKDPKTIASFLFTLYGGLRIVGKVNPNPKKLHQIVNTGLSVLD